MADLERRAGGRLLDRDHTGARLTELGNTLLAQARVLVSQHDHLVTAITTLADAAASPTGPLRLGVPGEARLLADLGQQLIVLGQQAAKVRLPARSCLTRAWSGSAALESSAAERSNSSPINFCLTSPERPSQRGNLSRYLSHTANEQLDQLLSGLDLDRTEDLHGSPAH